MSRKSFIAFIVTTLVIGTLFVAYLNGFFSGNNVQVEPVATTYTRQYIGDVIEHNGQIYRYNNDLINVLFLGIDTTDTLSRFTNPAYSGQSDAIYLLTINRSTREVRVLSINRNAMVDIDIYDADGQIMMTMPGQICLQYAYGIGDVQSIWATKNTVSEMLFDIPIDWYFVMNIEAINEINDSLGGVYVTMPRDYSNIFPIMTEGTSVHIMGTMAERFVRYRDLNEFNSVADRMDRQALYITALFDLLCNSDSVDMYNSIIPFIGDSILTNLERRGFDELLDYDYREARIDLLPGEEVATENWEEFNIDYSALEEYVMENFYVLAD